MTFTNPNRATIFVEDAEVLALDLLPGGHHLLKLRAPETAAHAQPGNFVHVKCTPFLAWRRPMSVLRADVKGGWIEILFRVFGFGTEFLALKKPGETVNLMGPIGVPFKLQGYRKRPLLLGAAHGIPPLIFLARHIKQLGGEIMPLVILGSESPFPFQPRPSQILMPGMPPEVIATLPLLEDWGIPNRLASRKGFPGCFEGTIIELAQRWLENLDEKQRQDVEIFGAGPKPVVKSIAELAKTFGLPCQISMEESMACAVGGCAGCAVPIQIETGLAMKRVCVDGPVFDAASVVF
jgi:dihydroorotate dehydrogenase electron transfer subunit